MDTKYLIRNESYLSQFKNCSKGSLCSICSVRNDCTLAGKYYKAVRRNGEIVFEVILPILYEDEEANIMGKKILDQIHKNGYLTKDEVLDKLYDYYFINITPRTLKYYGTIGLITSGIKEYIEGTVGSVSLYPKNTPEIIYLIKWLQVETEMTLEKINEYFKILEINDDYFKKFVEIVKEHNQKGTLEENVEKLSKNIVVSKDVPAKEDREAREARWAKQRSEMYIFKENFWIEREEFIKRENYITDFMYVAKNKALAEIGLLDITLGIDNIEDYVVAGDVKMGKDFIKVIFGKPVNKEVMFQKNKIEIY